MIKFNYDDDFEGFFDEGIANEKNFRKMRKVKTSEDFLRKNNYENYRANKESVKNKYLNTK